MPDERIVEIVEQLQSIEERLRDLAFGALQDALHEGDTDSHLETQLLKARRAVEKAIHDLSQ